MKKLLLVMVILLIAGVLTGCYCCGGYVTPCIQSYLIITATADSWTWGTIYANDESTNKYIHYKSQPTATISVPCNTWIKIYIIDSCGAKSHTEYIFTNPGMNYLYFTYWRDQNKSNDSH
jgi:hypothetical protein